MTTSSTQSLSVSEKTGLAQPWSIYTTALGGGLEVFEFCNTAKIKKKLMCKEAEDQDLKPGEMI